MPPRHDSRATIISKQATVAVAAMKRKNAERSDGERTDGDSDFDYTYNQRLPQQKQRSSKPKTTRPTRQQHAVPSLSSSDNSSPTAGEQESWRTELLELKRAKRCMVATSSVLADHQTPLLKPPLTIRYLEPPWTPIVTEEDRGFVFSRKKTTASLTTASAATTSSNHISRTHDFHNAENSLLTTPNPPPTPEGTPSRDKAFGKSIVSARPPKPATMQQQQPQKRQQNQQAQQPPERLQDSIVAIPMRETPMIKRNRDIRNTSRRSSFTLRGKRASSIGNGSTALPHPSIDPKSFFRHIAADDPLPIRMKQLMIWCARKTIDSQRSDSQSALKIAKLIEEEALAMLIAGKFSVSWYNRPLDMEPIRAVPKKPHQQNVENSRKLKGCEAQIAKLRKEDEEWTAVISSFNTFHASLLDNEPALPPGDDPIVVAETFADDIELGLLSADEQSLWAKHCKNKDPGGTPGSATKTSRGTTDRTIKFARESNKWMLEMMSTLEKEVDNLHDTLYAASCFDKIAKQYTDQVLEQIATALDSRQRPPLMNGFPLLPVASAPSSLSATSTLLGKGMVMPASSLKSVATSAAIPSPGSGATSVATFAGSVPAPSIGSDGADDPRLILRALSRLSLRYTRS